MHDAATFVALLSPPSVRRCGRSHVDGTESRDPVPPGRIITPLHVHIARFFAPRPPLVVASVFVASRRRGRRVVCCVHPPPHPRDPRGLHPWRCSAVVLPPSCIVVASPGPFGARGGSRVTKPRRLVAAQKIIMLMGAGVSSPSPPVAAPWDRSPPLEAEFPPRSRNIAPPSLLSSVVLSPRRPSSARC